MTRPGKAGVTERMRVQMVARSVGDEEGGAVRSRVAGRLRVRRRKQAPREKWLQIFPIFLCVFFATDAYLSGIRSW